MGTHDQTQIEQRAAADPERAAVAALERAERAAPGSLTDEARGRILAWRTGQLSAKAEQAAQLIAQDGLSDTAILASSAERPEEASRG